MKIDKLRGPALAAAAVLLIGGAASVFAGSPPPATQAPNASASQAEKVEPAGTDTDNLQQGDQTTPDVAGAGSAAEAAGESAKEATTETGTAADGPGGHADPAGQNVDHQFNGEE
jgi:hypothetical protein